MNVITLAGIIKIELRGDDTLRLSDGGIVTWGAETFESADPTFGSIGTLEPLTEGVGDEVPALRLSLNPPSTVAAANLTQPGWQSSPVRFWIAEVNRTTGAVTGTPELIFSGQLDTADLIVDKGLRTVQFDIVSTAEKLFEVNIGNTLSSRFHKYLFAGETGEDNALGLTATVAWGVESPTGGRAASGANRMFETPGFTDEREK